VGVGGVSVCPKGAFSVRMGWEERMEHLFSYGVFGWTINRSYDDWPKDIVDFKSGRLQIVVIVFL